MWLFPLVFTSSAALFDQAKYASSTIVQRDVSPRAYDQREAIVAIVFSALALEAFINEVGALAVAATPSNARGDPPILDVLGTALVNEEESRDSILFKFLLAKRILSGLSYDKGRMPYQGFKALVNLRNALAHVKHLHIYGWTTTGLNLLTKPPSGIRHLESKHVLADVSDHTPPAHWIEKLQCRATAIWACTTTADMIRSLIEAMPESQFRNWWQMVYEKYYAPTVPPLHR
jgi:hypothetical protein